MGIKYPALEVNLNKIKDNAANLKDLCSKAKIEISIVTKVFCADTEISQTILDAGINVLADSRLENLKRLSQLPAKKIMLRLPMECEIEELITYADISLNSELDTIEKIGKAAVKQGKVHEIILMVDLGDLREGVMEEEVHKIIPKILNIEGVELIGLGTNLTCYGGVIPDRENLGRLVALKNAIEKEYKIILSIVSGGNSSSLHLLINNEMPEGINQLRIGEALVLGRETAYGCNLNICHQDCFTLKAQIIEVKDKPTVPSGNIGMDAFGNKPSYIDKGIRRRAIAAVGRQDINPEGLTPIDKNISIFGGSSDHLLLDVSDSDKKYAVGDIVEFGVDYGCLLKAMTSTYIKKYYIK